jgi:serine protease AprX
LLVHPFTRFSTTAFTAAALGLAALLTTAGGAAAAVDPTLGYDPADTGSLARIAAVTGAQAQATAGNTGKGVDVAVIDTGVTPTTGLALGAGGNVVNGPDLSLDSQNPKTPRYTDGMGHGTHIASIVTGVATGSRVISLKVGAKDGTADVTQVIAAVNWVTQHAHDSGLNIRVLNLSYGTGSTQDYRSDPLAFAVETAWRKGILVVVAGGNDGSSRAFLANPALNPNILAVGAEDPMGTAATADDVVPAFSQRGNAQRHVDLVAPGAHVIGLRVPGGAVDAAYPASRVGTRFTRGSGTSQAAAVVSGGAAVLFAAKPALSPDQAKWLLTKTAIALPKTTTLTAGRGLLNVDAAVKAAGTVPATATITATAQYGAGTGSIEATRGSGHVVLDNVQLAGEKDLFGKAWNPSAWAAATRAGTSWSGGSYIGSDWTGAAFTSTGDWAGRTWVGNSWTGRTWVSENWAGRTWVDSSWTGSTWMGGPWAGASWS